MGDTALLQSYEALLADWWRGNSQPIAYKRFCADLHIEIVQLTHYVIRSLRFTTLLFEEQICPRICRYNGMLAQYIS